jgi:hypothetical protein
MRAGSTISIGIPNWSHRRAGGRIRKRAPAGGGAPVPILAGRKRLGGGRRHAVCKAARKFLGNTHHKTASRPITPNATHAATQYERKRNDRQRLEHFQEKWIPVFRPKMRQNKELEPHSDSIGMEKALDSAGARKAKGCCHRRQRQDKLKAGFCLRGLCGCFEGSDLRRQKFSLLYSLLRNRTQDAVCQAPQLLPTGIVLVLHLTLHSY